MPVNLTIKDGPTGAEWLSPAVMGGSLSGNAFTPAPNQVLMVGQSVDFLITVENTGDEDTGAAPAAGPTGPFLAALPLVSGARPPAGSATVIVSPAANGLPPAVQLADARGRTVGQYRANPLAFGFSPSGNTFVVATAASATPNSGFLIYLESAIAQGSGTARLAAGQFIAQILVSPSGGGSFNAWASSGLGFVPGREMLFTIATGIGGPMVQFVDLGPGVAQAARSFAHALGSQQGSQNLFSPSGDLYVPLAQIGSPIRLLTVPQMLPHPWRTLGMGVAQLTLRAPYSITQVRPAGFEAIRVQSDSDTVLVDSPSPTPPAVHVHLWVDTSSNVFDDSTARQWPGGITSSMQGPSSVVDRIARKGSVDVDVIANWQAVRPPNGQHFCAIAEAFTVAGTTPGDPKQRNGNALNLANRQIAQRNLVVV
jgi:hypothetical protein